MDRYLADGGSPLQNGGQARNFGSFEDVVPLGSGSVAKVGG